MQRKLFLILISLGMLGPILLVGPAKAEDRGEVAVAHGQTVSEEFAPIEYPMPFANISNKPSECGEGRPWCDTMKLNVGLAAKPEEANLQIELEWKGAPQLTAANYCMLYLWDDPQGSAAIKSASCEDNKATLDFVPINPSYQVVVRNFSATNGDGYAVTFSYR